MSVDNTLLGGQAAVTAASVALASAREDLTRRQKAELAAAEAALAAARKHLREVRRASPLRLRAAAALKKCGEFTGKICGSLFLLLWVGSSFYFAALLADSWAGWLFAATGAWKVIAVLKHWGSDKLDR